MLLMLFRLSLHGLLGLLSLRKITKIRAFFTELLRCSVEKIFQHAVHAIYSVYAVYASLCKFTYRVAAFTQVLRRYILLYVDYTQT